MKAPDAAGMAQDAEERRSRVSGRRIGPVRPLVVCNGHGHSVGTGASKVAAAAAFPARGEDRESSEHPVPPMRGTPPDAPPARLLTLAQTAAYLGLSPWTVRELQWKGRLPRVALSRKLLFDRADVDRLIEASKERP